MRSPVNIFWFRRDLRLHDNAALYHALKAGRPVLPIFIFDRNILDDLEDRTDKRVQFIYNTINSLNSGLQKFDSALKVFYDKPVNVFRQLLKDFNPEAVYTNEDYEPYAKQRDDEVRKILLESKVAFHTFKDHVIFSGNEISKDNGEPYTVFTPYSRKWLQKLDDFFLKPYPVHKYKQNFFKWNGEKMITPGDMDFAFNEASFPDTTISPLLLKEYSNKRDFPAEEATSRIGIHLRFGTVSIREVASLASKESEKFLSELIWRDFYQMILYRLPHVVYSSCKPEYDLIKWRNNEDEFLRWCNGQTGFPIVDAGMRELNATGYMHNRVRMVVASFLVKHLLIDWRWGEAYFAKKLLDYDLASNNGGWQWAAGSGCDAAPYFRIFNPYLQAEKFDPGNRYIRKWVPEFQSDNYPSPIVDHEFARKRCLEVFGRALKK